MSHEIKVGDRIRVLPGARNEYGRRPELVGLEGEVRHVYPDGDLDFGQGVVHRDYVEASQPEAPKFKVGDRVVATSTPGWWEGSIFIESGAARLHDVSVGHAGVVCDLVDDVLLAVRWDGATESLTSADCVKSEGPQPPELKAGDRVDVAEDATYNLGTKFQDESLAAGLTGAYVTKADPDPDGDIEVDSSPDGFGYYVNAKYVTHAKSQEPTPAPSQAPLLPDCGLSAGDLKALYLAGVITRGEVRAALGLDS